MKNLVIGLGLISTGICFLAVGCGPAQGTEGGPCFPNGTCNPGLTCASNICVDPNSNSGNGGSETSAGGNGSTSLFDLEACFDCGDPSCQEEKNQCEDLAGCMEILSCSLECGTDATCSSGCSSDEVNQENLTEVVQTAGNYVACATQACPDECTPDVNAGTGGSTNGGGGNSNGGTSNGNGGSTGSGGAGTSTGEACETEDETRGSCANSSLEICDGAEWRIANCAGCGIVAPTGECAQIFVKTFEESGDEVFAVEGDVREVVQTADAVGAEWYLDASQMGVIQFIAENPIDAERVELQGDTSAVGFVTLETPDGSSGCQYELDSSGRLSRYNEVGYDDYGYLEVYWYGCWGDFENYENDTEPSTATVLSVRTEVASTNEIENLTLTAILL